MKAHGLSGVKTVEELKVMSGINETKGYSSVNLDNAKKKTVFHTYVQFEKKLVSMEQIERTRLMVDFGLKIDNYMMNLAIQYGYIGMFMSVFPGAAVWGFLANVVIVMLTANAYSKIARRSLSIEQESIGVWKDIFMALSFISTIVNAMIIAFTSKAMSTIYGIDDKVKSLGIVILGEHIIIIFKYLISELIADIPKRITKRTKNEKYLENKAKQNIRKKQTRKYAHESLKRIFNPKTAGNLHSLLKEKGMINQVKNDIPMEKFMDIVRAAELVKDVEDQNKTQPKPLHLIESDNESENSLLHSDIDFSSEEEESRSQVFKSQDFFASIGKLDTRMHKQMAEPDQVHVKNATKGEQSLEQMDLTNEDIQMEPTANGKEKVE